MNDAQRVAALRALAARTNDSVLAVRFTRIADGIEKRCQETTGQERTWN